MSTSGTAPPRVFISYSHDSPEHEQRTLGLADRLRADGLESVIDQYCPAPPHGWPHWMESEVQRADFVLLVCTETYLRRVERREHPGKGRGVMWEAGLIYNLLYLDDLPIQKFIPVLFEGGREEFIPLPLRTFTYYRADTTSGYEDLYRHLTGQLRTRVPPLGVRLNLPAGGDTGESNVVKDKAVQLLPSRNPFFVGREHEMRSLHSELSKPVLIGVARQVGIRSQGGFGKTSIAIEYGWRHLSDYPGGAFFIDCSSDYQKQLAALSAYLHLPDADSSNLDRTLPLVKSRLESGAPSLLILDNVHDEVQWTSAELAACLPAGECRRLVTTRARDLPGVSMIAADSLPLQEGVEYLGRRRPDALQPANKPIVENIVNWLGGWAVALSVVGAYMVRRPGLTWEMYAGALSTKGLGTLVSTEQSIGVLPDYRPRVRAVLDDILGALSPLELRIVQYATLLPQDHIDPSWLRELVKSDADLAEVAAPPGFDDPGIVAVSDLQSEQLLTQRNKEVDALSLHRVLREALSDRLRAEDHFRAALQQRILDLAGDPERNGMGRPVGRVEWFNPAKGFGFISTTTGAPNVFVHISAVERAGLKTLEAGEWVLFNVANDKGKTAAVGIVKLVSA